MTKVKNTATGKLEKELEDAQEKVLGEMAGLQARLARHEILRAEHRHREDALEGRITAIGVALAGLRLGEEVGHLAGEMDKPIAQKNREAADAVIADTKAQMEKIVSMRKSILGGKSEEWLYPSLREIQGRLLEAEALIRRINEKDAHDRLAQASILGGLEDALHRHRKAEAYRNAAVGIADELVIDVPHRIAHEKGEGVRRESRSRLAKR